jgi:signal transduction histidine kinase
MDVARKSRLLVVEDDADFAESLVELLEPSGFEVQKAASVREAIETIARFAADVALIDVKLGTGDGVALIPELRALRPSLACLLMTAYASLDSAVAAVASGAHDYLLKPLDPQGLAARLRRTVGESAARAALEQQQRLLLMGELCAGIAHDLNNCLQVMLVEADVAGEALALAPPNVDELRHSVGAIKGSIRAAADVCRRVLTFAKGSPGDRACDATQVINGIAETLRKRAPAGVDLSVAAPGGPLWVRLGHAELEQLTFNLVLNGYHALNGRGLVEVELGEKLGADGPTALLRVKDTGSGMSEVVLPRIFDPYFSTRPAGEGTGLGLSIVHGMVVGAGGTITVESRLGEGTCFEIVLPLSEPAVEPSKDARSAPPDVRQFRILLVDDVPEILDAVDRTFRKAGYKTLRAASAEEALLALAESSVRLDGMISDIRLPGVSGVALAEVALERRPGMPVLLLSGDPQAGVEHLRGRVGFVHNPVRLPDLIDLLEARRGP